MPRFLVASDKFKGSLTAPEACHAMSRGILRRFPKAEIDECPIADGGEGFVNAILSARPGGKILVPCHDAVGRTVVASYGLLQDENKRTAVLEMAEAAGLWRLGPKETFPLDASTYGVGELIRHATFVSNADQILIGIGGSATNDGGAGMLASLGVKFLDSRGKELLPTPRALMALAKVELDSLLRLPPITVACDVSNPLLGARGATRIFGPQKGATPECMIQLEAFLELMVEKTEGWDNTDVPGAGAAGGLGYAFHHILKAELVPGFDLVSKTTRLADRVGWCDCVVTGEGSLDLQSLSGKGPAGVAVQGILAAKPIVAIVGRVDDTIRTSGLFHHITAILEKGYHLADCLTRGAEIVEHESAALPWEQILNPFGHELS
jgi:glycerate kinase